MYPAFGTGELHVQHDETGRMHVMAENEAENIILRKLGTAQISLAALYWF